MSTPLIDRTHQKRYETELSPEERGFIIDVVVFVPNRKLPVCCVCSGRNLTNKAIFSTACVAKLALQHLARIRIQSISIDLGKVYDAAMRMEKIYVQKPSMRPCASQYGDFTIRFMANAVD